MTPTQQHVVMLLESSRARAEALLSVADDYSATKLRHHIESINRQIEVVHTTGDYSRKERKR